MSHGGTVSGQGRTGRGDTELTAFSQSGVLKCPITLGTRGFGTRDNQAVSVGQFLGQGDAEARLEWQLSGESHDEA